MPYFSPYTVGDIRAQMQSRFVSDPSMFVSRLNEVLERLNDLGLFKGVVADVVYGDGTSSGFITLARRHLAVVGYDLNNVPMPVYSGFHEYQELGLGWQDPSKAINASGLLDMGDGYPTQADIATPGTVKIVITSPADAGKTIRLFGLDGDDPANTVYDASGAEGVTMVTANPSVSSSLVFSAITAIQAPMMVAPWRLYVTNSGVDTQIGGYEPGETRPFYRRYKLGPTTAAIRVKCRRRFVPVVFDTDPVIPGHMGAIEFGFRARIKEIAYQDQDAASLWAKAQRELDKSVRAMRGSISITLPFNTRPFPRPTELVR